MENKKNKSRGVASIIVGQHTINNAIKGELCKFWKKHNCLRGMQCRFQHRCVASVTKIKIPKHDSNLVTIMVTQVISLDPEKAAKYVIENQDKAIGIILDDYQLLAPTKEIVNDCRKKELNGLIQKEYSKIILSKKQRVKKQKNQQRGKNPPPSQTPKSIRSNQKQKNQEKSQRIKEENKNQNKRKTQPRWKLNKKKKESLQKKNNKIQYQYPLDLKKNKLRTQMEVLQGQVKLILQLYIKEKKTALLMIQFGTLIVKQAIQAPDKYFQIRS